MADLKQIKIGENTYNIEPYTSYLPLTGGNISGHIFLTGADASSSTGGTSQIVFGTSDNNHVVISSNTKALVINPSLSATTSQIVLYLEKQSQFPGGITSTGIINAKTLQENGVNIKEIYAAKDVATSAPSVANTANSSELTSGKSSGNTANNSAFNSGAASGDTANSATLTTGAASGNTANSATLTTGAATITSVVTNWSISYASECITLSYATISVATGAHIHAIGPHSHGLNSHTHTVPAHSHGLNSHIHSIGAHSHGLNSHTHTVPAHSHGLNSHTHKQQ